MTRSVERLGNQHRAARAFDTVRGESGELRVILGVIAAVRNEKNAVLAGGIGKAPNVGQQFFGARHIELAARQHKIGLDVHFPENEIARYHTAFLWDSLLVFQFPVSGAGSAVFRSAEAETEKLKTRNGRKAYNIVW